MQPKQDTYPIFEANQVLTNRHLNQVFNYLDEQERLTRANLIGIGIVCGLEIQLAGDGKSIRLFKGCGVTSEGYLLVELKRQEPPIVQEEVALTFYKSYQLPEEAEEYLPFKYIDAADGNKKKQYDLWELLPATEPTATALSAAPAKFLEDKAVLLFLELKKDGLRNCSPNNCDDKGAEVTATVRRLLIRIADLTKIIAAANQESTSLTPADLESVLLARLKLPDIRLPRYQVPYSPVDTPFASSEDVIQGFWSVIRDNNLAADMGKALADAFKAFEPLLHDLFPTDVLSPAFGAKFGFLSSTPTSDVQVRFLQYYYDFFDDLLKAYDEFRWKGAELMCACCPPAGLFPRHLMLGAVRPDLVTEAAIYRHPFLASSAIGGCEERTEEVRMLFGRLVEMVRSFTNEPPLFPSKAKEDLIERIRITPSKLADVALSDKAIPYYYLQDGAPPLFQRWNALLNRRGRAHQNLSYRSYQYTPTAPLFVATPLRYDLEPYNFLRVEGHLGQDYQKALDALLKLKEQYRLPIEVVALRTGAFDENLAVDLSKEDCRFQDLETLYDVTREEWFCFLAKQVTYLYDIPFPTQALVTAKSQFELITKYAPNFSVKINTIGLVFENYIKNIGGNVPEISPQFLVDIITNNAPADSFTLYTFFYIFNSYKVLQADLKDLDYTKLKAQFDALHQVAAAEEKRREDATTPSNPEGSANILKWEELDDRLEDILNTCTPETFRAILEEYARRITEVKQKQFLSFFLQKNPGIQHKAGVPMGGTFILVYHDDIEPTQEIIVERPIGEIFFAGNTGTSIKTNAAIAKTTVSKTMNRLLTSEHIALADKQILSTFFGGQTQQIVLAASKGDPADEEAKKIIAETIAGLKDGTVIADFFLPYLCCSDCSPVQFTLPLIPPAFSFQIGCTDPNTNLAEVTITPSGGVAPYSVKVDGDDFKPLNAALLLFAGDHDVTVRDSAGIQSLSQKVAVPGKLTFSAEDTTTYECDPNNQFIVHFTMSGGKAPYSSPQGVFTGNQFTGAPVASGNAVEVEVTDSAGCKASKRFTHVCVPPCDLPCDGAAIRCNYRFWVPRGGFNANGKPLLEISSPDSVKFIFEGPNNTSVDLSQEVQEIISNFDPQAFNADFKGSVQKIWIDPINKLIAKKTGNNSWLRLAYIQDDKETFGTLQVERFECLKFEFSLITSYIYLSKSQNYDVSYSEKGTNINFRSVTGAPIPIFIPPMDCETLNKCKKETVWQPLCKGAQFKLNIVEKIFKFPIFHLSATTSGATKPTTFVWEVLEATPSLANGIKVDMRLEEPIPNIIHIRLTAFSDDGCSVTIEDIFQL